MFINEDEWKLQLRPRLAPWGEDGDILLERQNPASEPLAHGQAVSTSGPSTSTTRWTTMITQ